MFDDVTALLEKADPFKAVYTARTVDALMKSQPAVIRAVLEHWESGDDPLRKGIATALMAKARSMVGPGAIMSSAPAGPDPAALRQARLIARRELDAHIQNFSRMAGRIAHHAAALGTKAGEHRARAAAENGKQNISVATPSMVLGKQAHESIDAISGEKLEKGFLGALVLGDIGRQVGGALGMKAGRRWAASKAARKQNVDIFSGLATRAQTANVILAARAGAAKGKRIGGIVGGAAGAAAGWTGLHHAAAQHAINGASAARAAAQHAINGASAARDVLSPAQKKQRKDAAKKRWQGHGRPTASMVLGKQAHESIDAISGEKLEKGFLGSLILGHMGAQFGSAYGMKAGARWAAAKARRKQTVDSFSGLATRAQTVDVNLAARAGAAKGERIGGIVGGAAGAAAGWTGLHHAAAQHAINGASAARDVLSPAQKKQRQDAAKKRWQGHGRIATLVHALGATAMRPPEGA